MARSKYEKLAQTELESQGWLVDYKVRPRFPGRGYQVDFLGAFDLLAYRSGDPLRFISIKGHANVPSGHRKLIESFLFPIGIQKEIWTYKTNGQIKKEII